MHEVLRAVKFIQTESRMVGVRDSGRGNGESVLNGDRVSGKMKRVLEMEGSNGCTMGIYLMPQNCMLKTLPIW